MQSAPPSYGAVDSARDKQMKSIGLGLLLGSVALVAVPAILMSSGSMKKYGSFLVFFTEKKDDFEKRKLIGIHDVW